MANAQGFTLWSARARIEWVDYQPNRMPLAADDSSKAEMYRRSQILLQTVIAQTGLEPRTCDAAQSGASTSQQRRHWYTVPLGVMVFLLLITFPVFTAVGALLAPLTDSFALNLYVAVTMGALSLIILSYLVYGLVDMIRRPRVSVRPEIHLPDAPLGGTPLTLRQNGASLRGKLGSIVVLLLAAGDCYAGVRAFIVSLYITRAPSPWSDLPDISLFCIVFIVAIFAVLPLFMRAKHLSIDDVGIHLGHGKKTTVIPWTNVNKLVITVGRSKAFFFEVSAGDSLATSIAWSTAGALDGAPVPPDTTPGAVFAAIVAQRAGITPRIEYE
jgi:hypothetical protein